MPLAYGVSVENVLFSSTSEAAELSINRSEAPIEDSSRSLKEDLQINAQQQQKSITLADAIAATLANQTGIQIAIEQYHFSEGVLEESAGPFDPQFDSANLYTVSEDLQRLNSDPSPKATGHHTFLSAEANKKTRLGTSYFLGVTVDQEFNPLNLPQKVNTSLITFAFRQPLLRGFLYGKDTTTEQSNYLSLEASYYDILEEISRRISDTAIAYWELVAAEKISNVLRNSVHRFQTLIQMTETLISEQEIAPSDLVQPLAELASRKIDLQLAEQEHYRTLEELKFAMNTVEESPCTKEMFLTGDDFPDFTFSYDDFFKSSCYLLQRGASERFDLLAVEKRIDAAKLLVLGARNDMLPQVDIVGGVTQRKRVEGRKAHSLGGSFRRGAPQKDWNVGINLSVPLYNSSAEGSLRQQCARERQLRLEFQSLLQQNLKNLREAISNQITLAKNVEGSNEVVKRKRTLVHNELKKWKAGLSTIFFLIDFENNLTDALVEQIRIYKLYFQNIVRLRFLSATLFTSSHCIETITPKDMTSLSFPRE